MIELKKLSPEGIEGAMEKVERYRLLNEPQEAESICRDILAVDPDHQEALVSLILSISDQLSEKGSPSMDEARGLIARLDSERDREYYAGLLCERKGRALLRRGSVGSGPLVYDWLRKAMAHFEKAEEQSDPGDDEALLRWNTCARIINAHPKLEAPSRERRVTLLE